MKMFSAAARLSAVVRRIVYAEFHASPLVSTFSTFPWGLVVSFFSVGFSGRFPKVRRSEHLVDLENAKKSLLSPSEASIQVSLFLVSYFADTQ